MIHDYLEILAFIAFLLAYVLLYLAIAATPGFLLHRKGVRDAYAVSCMVAIGVILFPLCVLTLQYVGNRLFPGIDS